MPSRHPNPSKKLIVGWWRPSCNWLVTHWMWLTVVLLTAVGAFFRLFRIEDTVMFLGDQGRDALIVSNIFRHADLVFIGPVTSVGNMYLGPLYYYFMLPFLWISYPSPMGPVYAVAALGILLIPVTFWTFKKIATPMIGLLAAVVLTFNPVAITLSRFSWNPNPEPFVSVIWFYCLVMAVKGRRWYWLGVAASLAILLQLHYVTLIAFAVSGLALLWRMVQDQRSDSLRLLLWPVVGSMAIIMASLLPLLLFDIRHDWLNWQAFMSLLKGNDAFAAQQAGWQRLQTVVHQTRARSAQILIELLFGKPQPSGQLLAGILLLAAGIFAVKEKATKVLVPVVVALVTILLSVVALSVYKNDVYIHYIAFLLPVVSFVYAYVLMKIGRFGWMQKIVIFAFLVTYIISSIAQLRWQGSGPSLSLLQETAQSIHQRIEPGRGYGLLLLSESKDTYGMNYRYYLAQDKEKTPLSPEELPTADMLLVIQEDLSISEPLQLPLYELLVFNVATPSATWQIPNGPRIFLLEKDAGEVGGSEQSLANQEQKNEV